MKVVNDLWRVDRNNVFIHCLEKWVDLSGHVLKRFHTYVTERNFFVQLGDNVSKLIDANCGIAGENSRTALILPVHPFSKHFHCYADYIQLYVSVEPDDLNAMSVLAACLADIN